MNPTPEQIAKLPKWARDHIERLAREVATWKGSALRFAKEQPEAPFYVDEWYAEPRFKRYIAVPTNRICVNHAGVEAQIYLPPENDSQRLFGIEISFTRTGQMHGDIAVIPRGHGQIQLLSKENMR